MESFPTSSGYPRERCVHELFEAQAAIRPDALAIVHGQDRVSFAELNARANRLARHLLTLGVAPDERVGICLDRGIDMVVGLLATLKAGGAYLPLDPDDPIDRLVSICQDGGPRVVLIGNRVPVEVRACIRSTLVKAPARAVMLDLTDDALRWSWGSACNLHPGEIGLEPRHLAYVVYRLESALRPMGVMVEHRGLVNHLWSMRELLKIGHDDRIVALMALGLDAAAFELHLPLVSGARMLMADRSHALSAALLVDMLEREGATLLHAGAATWRLMLDAGWQGHPAMQALCGGAPVAAELARKLRQRVARLWTLYGPSEATIWTMAAMSDDGAAAMSGRLFEPIGRPLANTRIYLLDASRQPVSDGMPGELYIGGDGVARGYLNQPGPTDVSFLADPYASGPHARMFRTGDLARRLDDGSFEFVGRQGLDATGRATSRGPPYGSS